MNLDSVAMQEVDLNQLSEVEGGVIPLLVFGAYLILGAIAVEGGVLLGHAISQALPCS